jgi:hypothetical protein
MGGFAMDLARYSSTTTSLLSGHLVDRDFLFRQTREDDADRRGAVAGSIGTSENFQREAIEITD